MELAILPPYQGFLGLEKPAANPPAGNRAVVIPFGLEASVTYGAGTKRGPRAIVNASYQVELFDDELWCEPYQSFALDTLSEPRIPLNVEQALEMVSAIVKVVAHEGSFPLLLGGEQSITPGALRPLIEKHPDLALLHFDAHTDLRDGMDGKPYTCASAVRRCLDHDNLIAVSLGVRNISSVEVLYLEANRHRVHVHWARDRQNWNLDEILEPLRGRPVYISFDLDAFDSSQMPATGTPEPGGLFWRDVTPILRKAFTELQVVGADITELAPIKGFHAYDFLAAKLAYKMLAYKFCAARPADG